MITTAEQLIADAAEVLSRDLGQSATITIQGMSLPVDIVMTRIPTNTGEGPAFEGSQWRVDAPANQLEGVDYGDVLTVQGLDYSVYHIRDPDLYGYREIRVSPV